MKRLVCDLTASHSQGSLCPMSSLVISGFELFGVTVEASGFDGKYFLSSCTIIFINDSIGTYACVDTGATGLAFVDKNLNRLHYPSSKP